MNRVAASEFELLSVIRALFDAPGHGHGGQHPGMIGNLLRRRRKMPGGVGPTALHLIEQTMARGVILTLVRRGGWRHRDSLSDGQVVSGRLWQRHPPPAFHFSPFALHLCRWLTSQRLRRGECDPFTHRPATIADELLLYLAMDLTDQAGCADALAEQRAARSSALCWLGFADLLALKSSTEVPPADISVYAFASWTSGHGAVVLEALQFDLGQRWVAMERRKRRLGRAASIVAVGRVQDAVVRAYFSALSSAGRTDLAAFVITAARQLLGDARDAESWEPALNPGGTLHRRSDARHATVVFLRALTTVRQWVEQARAVRFFDDGYKCAQLLLRLWEPLGDHGYTRAMSIADRIESIEGLLE
ncbi:MAG: hypothetical protein MJE77_05615 [Proteobacteria bacterium]|nr:hypothetical protein [Pseudomonadota bacterium]